MWGVFAVGFICEVIVCVDVFRIICNSRDADHEITALISFLYSARHKITQPKSFAYIEWPAKVFKIVDRQSNQNSPCIWPAFPFLCAIFRETVLQKPADSLRGWDKQHLCLLFVRSPLVSSLALLPPAAGQCAARKAALWALTVASLLHFWTPTRISCWANCLTPRHSALLPPESNQARAPVPSAPQRSVMLTLRVCTLFFFFQWSDAWVWCSRGRRW